MKREKCTAILLAAGRGKRMCSAVEKQFLEIGGYPLLWYALNCFQKSAVIDEIVLVTGPENLAYCREEIVDRYHFDKVAHIVAGGKERYDSVYQGLLACEDADYVMIHDSARPFITEEILERGFESVKRNGACVIGMPSKDTVKLASRGGFISETPDRDRVWIVQTPQIFEYALIRSAHEQARGGDMSGITDDAMVVEQMTGSRIALVEGSYRNIKVTTPEDLAVAEAFLSLQETENTGRRYSPSVSAEKTEILLTENDEDSIII